MLQEARPAIGSFPRARIELRQLPEKSLDGFSNMARLPLEDQMRAIDDGRFRAWLDSANLFEVRPGNKAVTSGLNIENRHANLAQSRAHIAAENGAKAG
jgi:hypothetical protein